MGVFLVKHLIFDFLTQGPYQYLNKGTYGHPGGLLHSSIHGATSFIGILAFLAIPGTGDVARSLIGWVILAEMVIHYHMDWFKVWWCKRQNYKPHTELGCTLDEAHWYWWWVGIDQFVHLMCYLAMTWVIVS